MNLNVFPPVYWSQIDSQRQQAIQEENNRKTTNASRLNQSKGKDPNPASYILGIGFVGFVVGFFVCAGNCQYGGFGETLGAWVLCTIIGLAIGGGIGAVAKIFYKSNVRNIDDQICRSNNTSENNIENYTRYYEKQYIDYVVTFETEAQNQSVRLAGSALAKEVIAWMTEGFEKAIDSADRSPHIEQVNVPFVFNVYKEKITCNLGTFDFELKRCRNLNNPIEQTALARAIASTIQLNIVVKYPKDASGTDISIGLNYNYAYEHIVASITYIAPNGNYQQVKDW